MGDQVMTMNIVPVHPKLLSCQLLPAVEKSLAEKLGCDPDRHHSIGIVTCDQDDSLYAALDHCTKHAPVEVVYGKSFYAGSAHASGPFSGEAIGVIAGADPDDVSEGLAALRHSLETEISFYVPEVVYGGGVAPAFFPHVIPSLGTYLSKIAGLEPGQPLAYLIAPPTESIIGLDAALKAAQVTLVKYFGPPTETNFGGAYLTGDLPAVEAAARAFAEAIVKFVQSPLEADRRPMRERR